MHFKARTVRKSRWATVPAVGAVILLLAACGGGAGTNGGEDGDGEPVTVGQLMPLTGALAPLGTSVNEGAEIARQLFNEDGGINGGQIEWETVDAPDEEAARKGAERLTNEGIDIVYGTYGSSQALAAIPVIVRAGGVYWEEGASAQEITGKGYEGVYRVAADAPTLGVDAVNFAAEEVAKSLGVDASTLTVGWAGVNTSYGQDVVTGMNEAAKEHGMKVVLEAGYPGDATDLSSVALQIKDASPDILILTSYPPDGAVLGRAIRAANIDSKAIIGTGGIHADPSWQETMGSSGNGVFNIGTAPVVDPEGLDPEAQKLHERYVNLFEEEYGEVPVGFNRMGFDGAWTLFQVMKEAESTSAEDVRAAAKEFTVPSRGLLNGDGLSFDENGQNKEASWFISQWQDEKLVPVSPADLATGKPKSIPLKDWSDR